MKFQLIALLATLAAVSADHEFRIWNNCPFTIWPGLLNNPGKALPEGGGFSLDKYNTHIYRVPDGWAGRVWARTECNGAGTCVTGDCGNRIQCAGAGGRPPVSLAEFTLDGHGDMDYYDVSLVDGYNLPISIFLIDGTYNRMSASKYDCNTAGCHADINAHCPGELAEKNGAGATVACKSACMAFNTDDYCCRGAHDRPETCRSSDWKVNYPAIFKQSCPDAYSYAYDDTSSTYTCHGNGGAKTGYVIKFCP